MRNEVKEIQNVNGEYTNHLDFHFFFVSNFGNGVESKFKALTLWWVCFYHRTIYRITELANSILITKG